MRTHYIFYDKKEKQKYWYFFYFSTRNMLWYSLEKPRRGVSNEYPQNIFVEKI